MVIEQAIEVIRKLFNAQGIDALTREELDALTMAIRSLEAWQKVPEYFEKRTKPVSDGEDRSKERHRYMQWLADYNAIKGLIEEVGE